MIDFDMPAQAAFPGICGSPAACGLVAVEKEGLSIVSLAVRRGQRAVLQERIAAHLGLALPDGPQRVSCGVLSAAGTGPGTWLVLCEGGGHEFTTGLKAAVGDTASIADQSGAYAVLRLSGGALRETLAKLVPLDLHPREFLVGQVAATLVAQIGAVLWRLDDGADGQPVFELAVYRSMAASLWHELSHHSP